MEERRTIIHTKWWLYRWLMRPKNYSSLIDGGYAQSQIISVTLMQAILKAFFHFLCLWACGNENLLHFYNACLKAPHYCNLKCSDIFLIMLLWYGTPLGAVSTLVALYLQRRCVAIILYRCLVALWVVENSSLIFLISARLNR